jgi:hypothetical protein
LRFGVQTVTSQEASLRILRDLIKSGSEHPYVRATALKIVRACGGRDDECELNAIFQAVKNGDPAVKALEQGFPYRADPNSIDFFSGASRSLKMCEAGACGGDCDDICVLTASLAGSLGFITGARGYGTSKTGPLTHVYAVALVPKRKAAKMTVIGMDGSVPDSELGWQPPPGRYVTAWNLQGV